nr:MAG: hypothetical protein [Bacteriophage sp.]
MKENLLWPKKLTEPPQLLVDVETLFKSYGNLNVKLVNFESSSDMKRMASYNLISVGTDGPDTFRIGFTVDVTQLNSSSSITMDLALPFQQLYTKIIGFKCHGYTRVNASPMERPNKTVEKTSLTNPPMVTRYPLINGSEHERLFKMESPEFEYDGSETQFSSTTGCYIDYEYENSNGNLMSVPEFADIWANYNRVFFETIVTVKVDRTYASDFGFRLGVA